LARSGQCHRALAGGASEAEAVMRVWIYIDSSEQVGDVKHVKRRAR
jgi:hypothetical protein